MVKVDGSRTGGMVDRRRAGALNLGVLDSEAAIALEVSIVIPAIGGNARVRALRVLGMGRL